MKNYFYYGSIRKSIIQFLDIFNDLKIAKRDSDGNITKYVDVPLKYSPKQKFFSWLYQRSHEKRYPIIGVELSEISYDQDRMSGRHDRVKISRSNNEWLTHKMIIPYNLSFNVHIATNYMHEMDQINEQVLPFFSDFVYTTVSIDDLSVGWDMMVKLTGASIDQDPNIDETELRSVNWVHSYTANTFLVKPPASIDVVKKVVNKIYSNEETWDARDFVNDAPSGVGRQDEEVLVIGWLEDDEIMSKFEIY